MFTSKALGIWRAVHTWSSLICTLFLFVLCLTGLPLIFQDELTDAFPSGPAPALVAEGTPRINLDHAAAIARAHYPKQALRNLFLDDDAPQIFAILAPAIDAPPDANHFLTLDAHTGAVLSDSLHPHPGGIDGFLTFVRILHSELFLALPGELVVALIGAIFLIALVSGVVLYAPFARRAPFGTVRVAGSVRLRWLDLHNVLGIVLGAWMLVVGFTGVLNGLSTPLFGIWEMTDVAKMLAGYDKLPAVTPTASIENAVAATLRAVPGMTVTSVTMPTHIDGSPLHYVVWLKGASPLTSRLMTPVLVDAKTGAVAKVVSLPGYLRAVEVSRPLHFGDYGGLPLKVLWALFDLGAIIVLGSGLYIWMAKRFGRRASARAEPVLAPAE